MTTITCGKCPKYSRSLGRCVAGKVNPKTKKNTLDTMQFMGAGYVCGHNKWRNDLIASYFNTSAD